MHEQVATLFRNREWKSIAAILQLIFAGNTPKFIITRKHAKSVGIGAISGCKSLIFVKCHFQVATLFRNREWKSIAAVLQSIRYRKHAKS